MPPRMEYLLSRPIACLVGKSSHSFHSLTLSLASSFRLDIALVVYRRLAGCYAKKFAARGFASSRFSIRQTQRLRIDRDVNPFLRGHD